ncbi:tyrosine-protein phosphatase [Desulfobacula toluolica]|uniref:protein-tyrosine-phosphatase n=1 Tax=Desulfobacula toluolica (strain DSM 7467 / Tol2) TaxID=651182 RepID=K0N499_DESTT|nr:CpsB/CapC family capsule biosynthesis tyrosine phosphatase [Desulfobacula toluolica]CCK78939.1 CapS: tyrosine-protein phosphatase [Desulfobacula toluolica Tol2]
MIDTHSHILAAIDDGARDLTESILFIKQAVDQGVEIIFATPHSFDGVFNCTIEMILQACSDLMELLEKKGISIQVLPGSEVRVNHNLVMEYDKGNLLTLGDGGKYLLIELPTLFITKAVSLMIRQLKDRGIVPIIAHAERNPMIMEKPEITAELVYSGAAIQITAGSLKGEFGKPAMRTAKVLLSMDQVFCMGSDIHPGRKYRMADAKKSLIKLVGSTNAELITRENPFAILESVGSLSKVCI